MDAREVARRGRVLPNQFAARVPAQTLAGLRLMAEGGEYGELAIELTATLARINAAVSAAEQRELRTLLQATGQPTYLIDQLAVRDDSS